MIRVLVVEDSSVARDFLVGILDNTPDIRVVGTAADGEEALQAVRRLRPDIITMDIHMPKLDGLEATRQIMETEPTPIIIVSASSDPREVATSFRAMEAGALAVLPRPAGPGHPNHETEVRELLRLIRAMSEVKVLRRWPRSRPTSVLRPPPQTGLGQPPSRPRVVAIGASTGGPPVLQSILAALPREYPLPILIVQHMTAGFIQGFCEWLAMGSALTVRVACDWELLRPGHVYLAPDDAHMKVGWGNRIVLSQEEPENGLRPAVSCLFRSVAEVYGGASVAGLLTGMGRDGAQELRLLRDKGALTFAQDRESSVVHGMPGEAIRLDAATLILPPDKIAALLIHVAKLTS